VSTRRKYFLTKIAEGNAFQFRTSPGWTQQEREDFISEMKDFLRSPFEVDQKSQELNYVESVENKGY
jgi:hypothetical protein